MPLTVAEIRTHLSRLPQDAHVWVAHESNTVAYRAGFIARTTNGDVVFGVGAYLIDGYTAVTSPIPVDKEGAPPSLRTVAEIDVDLAAMPQDATVYNSDSDIDRAPSSGVPFQIADGGDVVIPADGTAALDEWDDADEEDEDED